MISNWENIIWIMFYQIQILIHTLYPDADDAATYYVMTEAQLINSDDDDRHIQPDQYDGSHSQHHADGSSCTLLSDGDDYIQNLHNQ